VNGSTLLVDETTGASIGLNGAEQSHTRTIAELVERVGYLKNRTRILVADSESVHNSTDVLHTETLETLLRSTASRLNKETLPDLLERLSALGFSWRDLGRVFGVSVPALRKWRNGEPASGQNRLRVARLAAFCEIVSDQYLNDDPASWLEIPLHIDAPVTGIDLLVMDRFDLAFKLAGDEGTDPGWVLDQVDPEWRDRYRSPVEVFIAPDGMPGIRPSEEIT
jgi:transcriptional regulator with XRE-family HTH domain